MQHVTLALSQSPHFQDPIFAHPGTRHMLARTPIHIQADS
jgi:hypothetical protein